MRHVVEGMESLTVQPENLCVALIGGREAWLAMVTLIEGQDTANRGIAELRCNRGEADVGHAFFLVLSIR